MNAFFITARDENGAFYDAATFDSADDARLELSLLRDALDSASGSQAYFLRCAIAELTKQIEAAEWPPD
jgi:hypothetical protein